MNTFTRSPIATRLTAVSLVSFTLLAMIASAQQPAAPEVAERTAPKERSARPDLADTVIGTYVGDVISDSKGSSKPGVTLYVTKVDKSTVRVASDYARLPTVEVPIGVYSNQVLATRGAAVFVLNRNKSPQMLDFNPDGSVSFAGVRKP
jgi:hypothetical protein